MTGLIVQPSAGWVHPPGDYDERDEDLSPRQQRYLVRMRERMELQRVLGILVYGTVVLPLPGEGALGPARDHEGRVLMWSLWAPHRRVLIDVFRRLPPQEELNARMAFTRAHDLRYATVEPGFELTAKSVKEWLDGRGRT